MFLHIAAFLKIEVTKNLILYTISIFNILLEILSRDHQKKSTLEKQKWPCFSEIACEKQCFQNCIQLDVDYI